MMKTPAAISSGALVSTSGGGGPGLAASVISGFLSMLWASPTL